MLRFGNAFVSRYRTTWGDISIDRPADYLIISARSGDDEVSAYPVHLRDHLPTINIPLRETDEDVLLDLQPVFESVYAVGAFRSLDYSKPLTPALKAEGAEWAAALVQSRD